jgi:signal transduction histidine kinase
MKGPFLPRYFFASVLLLLILASVYVFSESQRFRQELLRQTEAKGSALAEAMESSAKHAILGNSILEDMIAQRLFDNARLIDQLLLAGPVDDRALKEIGAMNRLQKVDLLDLEGRAWAPPASPMASMRRQEMSRLRGAWPEEFAERHQQMMKYMWGRRWWRPQEEQERSASEPPAKIKEKKFWEGSAFGVAIGARSFAGIIAVHANADYILNFKKEIGVQSQIEELGRQADIEHIALLDSNLKIVAHTDPALVGRQEKEPLLLKVKAEGKPLSQTVEAEGGKRYYEVVKPLRLDKSPLGFLKIGLSLEPMEAAWRNSLRSVVTFGVAILAVGILGMAAIFYNQNSHMKEVKSLEARIARQEHLSALGNLAATVAHEIRNPLNAISMGLQRLKAEFRPTQDQEDYSRFVELMRGEVERLNGIVEQFLSLARPLDLKPEAVQVDGLLRELALLTESDAKSARVRTNVLAANLPPLRADRNYLKQVLLNLILNAIQAMPDGGTLTLEAKTARGNLLLTVADTGAGIAPDLLPRIFDPYFTTKPNGSGLGLSVARRIVEAHGGELTAASEPGRGSRFQMTLPLGGPGR